MDLTHTFTVPSPIATTWAAFNDLESIAPCMPGATVTAVDGNDFTGTIKIKLGPISLVYGGSGTYVERDEAGRRVVIEAKGKDKRGQGTAGATVVAVLQPDGDGTRVEVRTDLAITGKPAQFGRGVIQDVSDKLLSQFVGCISDRLSATPGAEDTTSADTSAAVAAGATAEAAAADAQAAAQAAETDGALASSPTGGAAVGTTGGATAGATGATAGAHSAARREAPTSGPAGDPLASDAAELDLGATVAPILLRRFGPPLAALAVVGVVVWWLLGRRRR